MEELMSASQFQEIRLVLAGIDLAGFTRAAARLSALEVAALLDRHYAACSEVVTAAGGRVVKFMGDGCFAVFPEERCAEAVAAIVAFAGGDFPSGMRL